MGLHSNSINVLGENELSWAISLLDNSFKAN